MALDEQSLVRRQKLDKLRESQRAYPHNVTVTHQAAPTLEKYASVTDPAVLAEAGSFILAGRVAFIRSFGKAGFVKIRDRSGVIQLYVARDKTNEQGFEDFKD